jgi:uncharacterized protein (TIGR02611 family)
LNDRAEHEHWYSRFRERVRRRSGIDLAYRIMVAVVGTAVAIIGIMASFPAVPGPGVLILFAGLAILGTEFLWAQRVLRGVRRRYDSWVEWTRLQPPVVRLGMMALTGVLILAGLAMLWVLGAFDLIAGWLGPYGQWLRSPLS